MTRRPRLALTLGIVSLAACSDAARAAERPVVLPGSDRRPPLAARLTLPDAGPPSHGVLLLAVAGPTDADMSLGPRGIYSAVAQRLAAARIASLRFAARGVGGSGGDWLQTDLETRRDDAAAALAWLRARPELAGAGVGAVGLSEGGAVALSLGAAPSGPAFVVALSTAMEDGPTILRGQRDRLLATASLPPEQIELVRSESDRFLTALEAGDEAEVKSVLSGPAGPLILPPYHFVPRDAEGRTRFALSPWYRSQVGYDIDDEVRRIGVPVLAVYGSLDQVIDPERSAALARELLRGESRDASRVTLRPGLNHLLMPAVTGSPLEYGQLPEILSAPLWDEIAAWILAR